MTNVLEVQLGDAGDIPDPFARGLRGYAGAVAGAFGVGLESCAIDVHQPAWVYVALDRKLPAFPGRDLALLWDERFGWSAAVETHSGEDLLVVAYRGGELVPRPDQVVAFVAALGGKRPVGHQVPPPANTAEHRLLGRFLRRYIPAIEWNSREVRAAPGA